MPRLLTSKVFHDALARAGRLVALGLVATSMAVHAEPMGRCTAEPVPTDSQDVTCVLEPAAGGRALRFVAWFGGSHDDTTIKLEARLRGEPLTCLEGSKTTLSFEDGIVYLDCRFRAPPAPPAEGTSPSLEVALTVHHAQYVSSSLDER